MTIIAGGFSFSEDAAPQRLARALAARSRRYDGLTARLLLQEPRVTCYVIEPVQGVESVHTTELPDGTKSIVAGHVGQWPIRPDGHARGLPDGRWISLTYSPDLPTLRLGCDLLGTAWLYVARIRDGYLFSSDFGALASVFPGSLTLDEDGILTYLALGYVPDSSTCFKEISVLAPGCLVELRPAGTAVLSRHRLEYGDRYAAAAPAAKFEALDELLAQGIATWCGTEGRDLVVSLSGGYDSRYGLALLYARRLNPKCITWGHPRSPDARTARILADRLNLDWTLYNSPMASWEAWTRCLEQAGAGGFQWGPWSEAWLARLAESGKAAVLGFLGDALSGKHLVRRPARPPDWLEDWEAWSLDEGWAGSPLLRPGADARLRVCTRARLETLAAEADVAFPHQKAMHLDLFGRQRRFAASQANLMTRFLSPSLFFYTRGLLEFWGNLPYDDLQDQALYLAYGRQRFPALFYEERERRTLARRASGTMKNLAIDLFPMLKQRLAPSEIDLRTMYVTFGQDLLSLLDDVLPQLDSLLHSAEVLREVVQLLKSPAPRTVRLRRLLNVCSLIRTGRRSAWPASAAVDGRGDVDASLLSHGHRPT